MSRCGLIRCFIEAELSFILQCLPETRSTGPLSYRALGVHQQQVLGQSVVHARQHVGPRVGRARANQEVAVFFQQFFGVAAAHLAVVPHLALQLLLSPEGHRAREERAGVVHGRRLVDGGDLRLGRRMGLGLDGILEGLWYRRRQRKNEELEGFWYNPFHVYLYFTLFHRLIGGSNEARNTAF